MKWISIISLLLSINLKAQTSIGKIIIKKTFWDTKYMQNDNKLKIKQLLDITKVHSDAHLQMKKAKKNAVFFRVIGISGSLIFVYPFWQEYRGKEPNKLTGAIGAGMILSTIPFSIAFNKRTKKAISLYNTAEGYTELRQKVNFNMGLTHNGIGIQLNF